VSVLFETVRRIEDVIAEQKLDLYRTKGQIALRAGFSLALVKASTPDDPARLTKLREAAQAVLGQAV
jgi:hypothetical protein